MPPAIYSQIIRFARGRWCGENAAGGLHDAETGFALGEAVLQGVNVLLHAGGEISIERDGRAAFVFAEFGKDLMRERDGQAERCECMCDPLLVSWIGKGEE